MVKFVWRSLIITFIIILLTGLILGIIGELDRIRRIIWGVEPEVKFYNYNLGRNLRKEVVAVISSYAKHNVRYPLPATINEETGAVIPGTAGKIIDITATVDKIFSARSKEEIEAVDYKVIPYLLAEDLLCLTEKISTYQTRITGSENRKDNIKLATQLINNTLVTAGEIFSFNQEVSPRTKIRGFKESPQIVRGKLTLGVGGGICQVSTTLYNAIAKQNLKIVERHLHSKEVGYVPQGQDAAVAWKYLDLKFKNTLDNPIIIKAEVKGDLLNVSLLGNKN
ncbi:VanW family protein [Halanaerobacter jeridensis]|uniref:VanW family protein n=1 Tax=Halanaerobacter jeridensis TaxID=706427 RepID=UPI0030843095